MKTRWALPFFGLFLSLSTFAQDAYHNILVDYLETNYGITNPSFPIANTEAAINASSYIYGNGSKTINSVMDMDFSTSQTLISNGPGDFQYDTGFGVKNTIAVQQNDLILMSFWGRKKSTNSSIYVFIEDGTSFDKAVYFQYELTDEWVQYWFPAKVTQAFAVDNLVIGFHIATMAQEIEIGGLTLLNYGSGTTLAEVPNFADSAGYEGDAPDAAWRAEAAQRIDNFRKADLNLNIEDMAGQSLSDLEVRIEQLEHSFGFGSAIVPSRFPGNRMPNTTYVSKLTDLDGLGHGFNEAVTENALKWDGWEEEWIGTPMETISAIENVTEMGIKVRGHVLLWPGWDLMPDDVEVNKNNITQLKNRVFERVDDMLTHPQLKDLVKEWDVINEITFVRDVEEHLEGKSGYVTGREFYKEVFDRAANTNPDIVRYINDYAVITQGAKDGIQNQRFKTFLDELFDAGTPIQGIGIQSHIPSTLPSILDVKDRLDEYTTRYNVPIKITEYDTDRSIGDELAGQYMGDFLTIIFSHPNVESFLMWGFWDGNHWKENAPMFDLQWNLKPAGVKFNELVFGDWWTSESQRTNANGQIVFRSFKGRHKITVINASGGVFEEEVDLEEDMSLTINVDFTSSVGKISDSPFHIYPNPVSERLFVDFPKNINRAMVQIYTLQGQPIGTPQIIHSDDSIEMPIPNGAYLIKIQTAEEVFSDLVQVFR